VIFCVSASQRMNEERISSSRASFALEADEVRLSYSLRRSIEMPSGSKHARYERCWRAKEERCCDEHDQVK
jgi:hypothetical protein